MIQTPKQHNITPQLIAFLCGLGLLTPLLHAQTTTSPATEQAGSQPDLLTDFQRVVSLMRHPPATGVLVADFTPNSAAAACGVLPGDIITELDIHTITTENSLREAVAQGIAEGRANDMVSPTLVLRVRRLKDSHSLLTERVTFRVPRGPLGITARSVEAGVPFPLNPAGTPRTDFQLQWDKLPTLNPPPGQILGQELWTRLYLGDELYGNERLTCEKYGNHWALTVVSTMVDDHQIIGAQTCRVLFVPTDNRSQPGFTFKSLDFQDTYTNQHNTFQKLGATVRGHTELLKPLPGDKIEAPQDFANPTITIGQNSGLGIIPSFAFSLVAASLPHQPNITAPLAQFTEVDGNTHLGFALHTLGPQKITVNHQDLTAWGVELWHWGRVEQTYYFDDQNLLIQATLSPNTDGLRAVRVASQEIAEEGITLPRKP